MISTSCSKSGSAAAPAGSGTVGAMFEIRQLTKGFGGPLVLDHIDLTVQKGKTTVILGPSGCGKTVLIKHFVGLLRADSGEVFFDGQQIDQMNERELIAIRRRCGYLFQGGALFDSQSVAENVGFPLRQHTRLSQKEILERVREKLGMVGLAQLIDRMPAELSGGQQKRVALARAIALEPEVILYDEPTTGLDPIRSDTISELILKLQRELRVTSVVVTHDLASAYKISDRIIMLGQGRIIFDGSAAEIQACTEPQVRQFIEGRGERFDQVNAEGEPS